MFFVWVWLYGCSVCMGPEWTCSTPFFQVFFLGAFFFIGPCGITTTYIHTYNLLVRERSKGVDLTWLESAFSLSAMSIPNCLHSGEQNMKQPLLPPHTHTYIHIYIRTYIPTCTHTATVWILVAPTARSEVRWSRGWLADNLRRKPPDTCRTCPNHNIT